MPVHNALVFPHRNAEAVHNLSALMKLDRSPCMPRDVLQSVARRKFKAHAFNENIANER
ncbi:hypothetical protein ACSQ76_18880 [Roseovarius sp. B08]|uniref:hypothetical protein n=1 Tax=Roseovarius sp. B08 TaxID=3449223 RepID=UPI003EDB9A15